MRYDVPLLFESNQVSRHHRLTGLSSLTIALRGQEVTVSDRMYSDYVEFGPSGDHDPLIKKKYWTVHFEFNKLLASRLMGSTFSLTPD